MASGFLNFKLFRPFFNRDRLVIYNTPIWLSVHKSFSSFLKKALRNIINKAHDGVFFGFAR